MALKPGTEKKPASSDRPAPVPSGAVKENAEGAPAGMPRFLVASSSLQRKSAAGSSGDGAEIEADQLADRALSSGASPGAASDFPSRRAPAEGAPLAPSTRQFFEGRFDADFSGVRIHTGQRADADARAAGAVAFTKGPDIVFRRGRYSPGTSAGRRLLAHELVHVVQQRADSQPRVQRQSGSDEAKPDDSRPRDFLWKYRSEAAAELRERLQRQIFDLGSPYLTWTAVGESRFKAQVAEDLFPDASILTLLWDLEEALAPIPESQILRIVDRVVIDDQSENAVPWLARELMPLIEERTKASLRRIVPRYLAARNQAVLSLPNQSQPDLEPSEDQVPTSAPVDKAVLGALVSGVTAFDELGYRNARPAEGEPLVDLGLKNPGQIEFLASQGAPQWVRVENRDATAEDVAAVLYGSSTLAYKIVAAPPLFGIQPGSLIEEPYRRLWLESLDTPGLEVPLAMARMGYYPVDSPLLQTPGGVVGDEIVLSQAKGRAPTGAGRMGVMQQMRQSLGLADQLIASAGKLKIDDGLTSMRARLDARSRKVKEADPVEAEAWGPQAAAQFDTLNEAAEGLAALAKKIDSYPPGEIPGYLEEPLRHLATAYVEAASLSEFADAGKQQIAVARELFGSFSLDVLEGKLRNVHDSLENISPDDEEALGGKTAPLISREKALRHDLAQTRSLVSVNPDLGVPAEEDLQKRVNKLVSRVQVINTLNAIQNLMVLLFTNPMAMAVEPVPGDPTGKQGRVILATETRKRLVVFHAIWLDIAKTAFHGTDQELKRKVAKAAHVQKELRAVLKDAMALAENCNDPYQVQDLIDRIETSIFIAAATMGVGEIVGGVAIAADLAEGGAGVFLLTTGAEALASATLNAKASGNWENFGSDLFWNFITFGAMKGGSRLFTAAFGADFAKTTLGAVGEFATSTAFGMVPALMKARVDAGRDLTAAESREVVRDNFLQSIAFAIGARLAKGSLPKLPSAGGNLNSRIQTINQTRESLRDTANELAGAKSPDEAAIHNLAANEETLLAEQSAVLEDAEASPGLSKADRAELQTAKANTAEAAERSEATRVAPYLEDAGQNQLLCAEGHLDEVKAFYKKPPPPAEPAPGPVPEPEAPKPPKVVDLPPDEVTQARRIRVEPTDGTEPFTVTEKVTDYDKLHRDLRSEKEDVQLAVAKVKEQAIARGRLAAASEIPPNVVGKAREQAIDRAGEAEWNRIRASETKPIYNVMERQQGVQIQQTLPRPQTQRVLYDVKVVAIDISGTYGGQAPNVNLVNAEGWAPRTFDNVAYEPGPGGEVSWALPFELKSEGAVLSSVAGGVTGPGVRVDLLPSSKLGGQVRTTKSLRQQASDLGGTLVLKGRDVLTNEEVVIRVDPDRIGQERVTTYGEMPDVVAPDLPPDDSPPFPLTPDEEPTGPATGPAKPPRKSSSSRSLDDILTKDGKGFTESAVQDQYKEYVKEKVKQGETPKKPEEWARATRGEGQRALENALGKRWRRRRGRTKLPN